MLAPAMRGTTAGTEALILQIRWAFELGYRRMEWTCDPHNSASMSAALRLGFSYEATFRQRYASKGRNRDQAHFSILDGEWAAIDAQHREWLDPANFDADGRQRRALSAMTGPLLTARPPAQNWQPSRHQSAHAQPIGPPLPATWAPPSPPVRQTLNGSSVACVPLTLEHAPSLVNAFASSAAEHWAWLSWGPFETAAAHTEWVGKATLTADPLFFALEVSGVARGVASFLRVDVPHGCIEIGHLSFSPALQRTRAATEALYLLMRWAFEAGYRRVEWKCNALNAASRRAALRLGFTPEGVLRQHRITKGASRNTAWFSVIDSEWPTVKAACEAWLDEGNFDGAGVQRRSLESIRAAVEEHGRLPRKRERGAGE